MDRLLTPFLAYSLIPFFPFSPSFPPQISEWAPDYHPPGGCDPQAWQYATDFPLSFHGHCYVTDLVRRRRWGRRRRVVTAGPWIQLGRTPLVHVDVAVWSVVWCVMVCVVVTPLVHVDVAVCGVVSCVVVSCVVVTCVVRFVVRFYVHFY